MADSFELSLNKLLWSQRGQMIRLSVNDTTYYVHEIASDQNPFGIELIPIVEFK
jgi:hypothetical protein